MAFLFDFSPVLIWAMVVGVQASLGINSGLASFLSGLSFLSIPFVVVYWVVKDCIGGVSVGKWMAGCRVVSRRHGIPIGLGNSFLRNLIFLIPLSPLLELAVASFRPDGRRIGDLLADTTVVMGRPKWVNGQEVVLFPQESEIQSPSVPHPLDD